MSAGELVSFVSAVFYYGGWASLLLIPYGMFVVFSKEKKELERNSLVFEEQMTVEAPLLKKE